MRSTCKSARTIRTMTEPLARHLQSSRAGTLEPVKPSSAAAATSGAAPAQVAAAIAARALATLCAPGIDRRTGARTRPSTTRSKRPRPSS